jgi:hypothetical protein
MTYLHKSFYQNYHLNKFKANGQSKNSKAGKVKHRKDGNESALSSDECRIDFIFLLLKFLLNSTKIK